MGRERFGLNWLYLRMNGETFVNYSGKPQPHTLRRESEWTSVMRVFISPAQKKHQGVGANCCRLCGSHLANRYHLILDRPKALNLTAMKSISACKLYFKLLLNLML